MPFLSIIDQNGKILKEIFELTLGTKPTNDLFLIHHHLSDYYYKKEDTEYGYDKSEILIEGWDSEVILTTFVQLFHTIFSNKNRVIRKFHKILGGIIILDEIQTFPYKYWLLFKNTAEVMAQYFNTYFILTTATQPIIFDKSVELLPSKEKYFNSLNRTKLIFDIEKPKTILDLANEVINEIKEKPTDLLIVLNTINSAVDLFNTIKEPLKNMCYEIHFLSSHIIPKERLIRIEKIKNSKNKKIVISTQLIEAGVDIDLNRAIRDFGPLDSINQVTGRVNRNMNSEMGEVKIVALKESESKTNIKRNYYYYNYIYDPILIEKTKDVIKNISYKNIFENEFFDIINKYYENIPPFDDASKKLIEEIKNLDYDNISKFKLIEEKTFKVDIFVEVDDEAKEVWSEYCKIFDENNPIKRKEKFLQIRSRFYNYVISVSINNNKNLPPEFFGIRYISKSQLNEYYDADTGFGIKNEFNIW